MYLFANQSHFRLDRAKTKGEKSWDFLQFFPQVQDTPWALAWCSPWNANMGTLSVHYWAGCKSEWTYWRSGPLELVAERSQWDKTLQIFVTSHDINRLSSFTLLFSSWEYWVVKTLESSCGKLIVSVIWDRTLIGSGVSKQRHQSTLCPEL